MVWPATAAPSMSVSVLTSEPERSSSRCDSPTRKAWNEPVWTPADMRNTTRPALVSSRPTSARRFCIPSAEPAARFRVARSGEEQQERVTAELQQSAAGSVRDLEERLEAGADRVRDLFGADLAVTGQPFGHLGEPGDVDEQQGAVDRLGALVGGVVGPFDGQPGDIGAQRPVRGCVGHAGVAAVVPFDLVVVATWYCPHTSPNLAETRPTARRPSLPAGNRTPDKPGVAQSRTEPPDRIRE